MTTNYEDVGPGEVLVAAGHTHPYSAEEGGHTDVSFSGGDLAGLVLWPERVMVVQSGSARFAVAKTADFDAMVADAETEDDKQALMKSVDDLWNDAVKDETGELTVQERVENAAKEVCSSFHLVYYAGSGGWGGTVTRSDAPEVHVEA